MKIVFIINVKLGLVVPTYTSNLKIITLLRYYIKVFNINIKNIPDSVQFLY